MISRHTYNQIGAYVLLFLSSMLMSTHADASHNTSTTTKPEKYDIAIPVLFGVTLVDIVPDFGDPRGGGTRSHEGQDIMAPEGTPIVSPVKGTVVRYGTAASPGKYVYVKGTDGYTYAFMHLDEIAKLRRNQKMNVGDLLGTVGETGNAKGTTPHLHFEIRKGKPIDPYIRLKKEFTFEEKIQFLNASLSDLKNDDALVDLMVERYRGLLVLAQAEGLTLNRKFTTALKDTKTGVSIASTSVGLGVGSTGEHVKLLQNALIALNMGPTAYRLAQAGATGYFGPLTERALIEFQTAHKLTPDGIFGQQTKSALVKAERGEVKGVATTMFSQIPQVVLEDLGVGAEGAKVRLVQAFLIARGVGPSADALRGEGATGYFGAMTEAALREYQSAHGMLPTGRYDASVREHLAVLL
jgi:peptidoglycan hydrolase-like protein with peptidoglycan-binding domain